MKTERKKLIIKACSEEVGGLINSIKGLLLLTDRYEATAEVKTQMALIARCINGLEDSLKKIKDQILEED